VEREFDLRSLTIFVKMSLFKSVSLVATMVFIEKTRRASDTNSVSSAESFCRRTCWADWGLSPVTAFYIVTQPRNFRSGGRRDNITQKHSAYHA